MLILKEEWATHEKMLKAVFRAGTPAVKHFWFEAVSACGLNKTDGVLADYRLPVVAQSCGVDAATVDRYVVALVDARLFHDAEALKGCAACKQMLKDQGHSPGPDDLIVHDFLDHNSSKRNKGALGKKREKRKNDLGPNRRSEWVKQVIFERDLGLCRYCGIRPNPDTQNKPDSLEHDHIDPACFHPNHGNFPDGMATSCRRCNRAKGEHKPDECGIHLLAIGITWLDVKEGRAVYVDTPDEAASAAALAAAAGDAPHDPEGVGPGSGTDQAGFAPGSDRDGPGEARDPAPDAAEDDPEGEGRARGQPP